MNQHKNKTITKLKNAPKALSQVIPFYFFWF